MRHRLNKKTLDRSSSGRRAMFRQLATSLVLYEHVITTVAKAKIIRQFVEQLITRGKEKTLANRRALMRVFLNEAATNKTLQELGPRYVSRQGGYTRIIKLGTRKGDGSEKAEIQLIRDDV